MTEANFNQLRELARMQRDGAIRAAEIRFSEALRSIDLFENLTRSQGAFAGGSKVTNRRQLADCVRETVCLFEGEFDVRSVVSVLQERHPELSRGLQNTSVSTALRRLEEGGEIEMVYRGSGKKATRYKKCTTVAVE